VWLDHTEDKLPITQAILTEACEILFSNNGDDLLFYFSGHGVLTPYGGHLCVYDSKPHDWGVQMQTIVDLAMKSKAREILIILDCCHSGDIANPTTFNAPQHNPLTTLRENMTVIAASHSTQVAKERDGHGLFTRILMDGLKGAAADPLGQVTAPALYAYAERRFPYYTQRPNYKSYATHVTVVRECAPLIERFKLEQLTELFPTEDHTYKLDPEYEPEDEHGNVKEPVNRYKVEIARLFKDYRDAGLLKPSIPGEQLYWTARHHHYVQLTARGQEYWWLLKNGKI
jgi:hypothetical protein